MFVAKGTQFLAKGPLRLTLRSGKISSRGITFLGGSEPLVVKVWECFDVMALEDSDIELAGIGQLELSEAPYPAHWSSFIRSLPPRDLGKVMVVGESDTGKSTLCTLIANKCLSSSPDVYLVDSDVGQSNIGPPTTVGLGHSPDPLLRLTDASLVDAYFAGDTSPAYCLEEVIEGTRLMVQEAEGLGSTVLIDTCGLVSGSLGEHLTKRILEAVSPNLLILLEREAELSYLQKVGAKIACLSPLATGRKNLQERRAFRLSQYLFRLKQARLVRYDLSRVAVEGYLARRAKQRGLSQPSNPVERSSLSLEDLANMQQAIVGLHRGDRYVDLGVIDRLESDENKIGILTTCRSEIDRIIIGNLRLGPNGESRLLQAWSY